MCLQINFPLRPGVDRQQVGEIRIEQLIAGGYGLIVRHPGVAAGVDPIQFCCPVAAIPIDPHAEAAGRNARYPGLIRKFSTHGVGKAGQLPMAVIKFPQVIFEFQLGTLKIRILLRPLPQRQAVFFHAGIGLVNVVVKTINVKGQ